MISFLNGEFLPEEQATVSIFDRAFLYGDGLFETIPFFEGRPFRMPQHLERLREGAEFLRIALPYSAAELEGFASELVRRTGLAHALMRLTVSRGVGAPGYSIRDAGAPTIAMAVRSVPALSPPAPIPWRLITSSIRLNPHDQLSRFKTCNKLPQILARAEAERARANEALLLNRRRDAAESSSANLFWIESGRLCTPPLSSGALPGITRAVLLEIAAQIKVPWCERLCPGEALQGAQGIVLSLSSFGLVEIVALDGKTVSRSPLTRQLYEAYRARVQLETGASS
jgi:branched-chain amino acid aminotransferase